MDEKKSPEGFRKLTLEILCDEIYPTFSWHSWRTDGINISLKGFIHDPDYSPDGEFRYGPSGSEFAGREVHIEFSEQSNERISFSDIFKNDAIMDIFYLN